MNRYQYLESLDRHLTSLPYDKRREVMYDYEEYFNEGTREGETEEALIDKLGSPDQVALQYVTGLVPVEVQKEIPSTIESMKDPYEAILQKPSPRLEIPKEYARRNEPVRNMNGSGSDRPQKTGNSSGTQLVLALVLGFFNLFFGIWIFFAAYITVFSLIIAGVAVFFAGIVVVISSFVSIPVITIPAGFTQTPLLVLLFGIIITCVGGLMLIPMYYCTKLLFYVTKHYIQWNIQVIRGY